MRHRFASFFLELLGGIFLLAGHHISGGADGGGDGRAGENGWKVHWHNNHSCLKFASKNFSQKHRLYCAAAGAGINLEDSGCMKKAFCFRKVRILTRAL